jgi:hypothetical protein
MICFSLKTKKPSILVEGFFNLVTKIQFYFANVITDSFKLTYS